MSLSALFGYLNMRVPGRQRPRYRVRIRKPRATKRSGAVLSAGSGRAGGRKSHARSVGYEDDEDQFLIDEVDLLDPEERGDGGYDSSGRKEEGGDEPPDSPEPSEDPPPKRGKIDYSA